MERTTNYYNAVHYLKNNYILCNDIINIDPQLELRFDISEDTEIFQFFLTDASLEDIKFFENSFNLKFAYSEVLNLFVLCVDHYGTSWKDVPCTCSNDRIDDDCL